MEMSNDDSFNDSDEMFSLYSSKKVTDTFKAQLKKIAADNLCLNKALPNANNTDDFLERKEKNTKENSIHIENRKVTPTAKKPTQPIVVIDSESINTPTQINDSLEDSVEIISEFTLRNSTRRSQRLRKKNNSNSLLNNSCNHSPDILVLKQSTRGRKKKSRGKKKQTRKSIDEVTLEDSPQQAATDDELNPEVSVKVIWKSVNIKKFQIRKFQKLSYIYELLSKEENIPESKIILTFNNIRVSRNDTPDSLNLQVYHFLDGGVLSELSNICHTPNSGNIKSDNSDSNCVMLKFQDANKKIIKISLNKNEKLKVGMIKCSEQLEIPVDKIRFFFDGELLEPDETPASLGLENEEIIDFKIC